MKVFFGLLTAAALPVFAQQHPAHAPATGFASAPRAGGIGIGQGHGFGSFDRTIVPAQETGRTFSRPASTFSRPLSTFSQPSFAFPPFAFAYPNHNGAFRGFGYSAFGPGRPPGFAATRFDNVLGNGFAFNLGFGSGFFYYPSAQLNDGFRKRDYNHSMWGPYYTGYRFPAQRFGREPFGGSQYGYGFGNGMYPFGWPGGTTVFVLNQDAQPDWGEQPMAEFGQMPQMMPGEMSALPPQGAWAGAPENMIVPQQFPGGWIIAQSPPPPEPVVIDFPPGTRILR